MFIVDRLGVEFFVVVQYHAIGFFHNYTDKEPSPQAVKSKSGDSDERRLEFILLELR